MTTTTSALTGNAYLDSLRTPTQTATSTATGSSTIDQSGFLKLLTTQMTNQDPTAPMDTSTMVQQLSEMASTSGITEMNASLKSLLSEVQGNRIGDAASWIGKAALVSSPVAQPLSNGGYAGEITLPSDATSVNVALEDSSGNIVHSESINNQKAGPLDWSWDGKLADGSQSTSPLSVVVTASGAAGAITPTSSTWATVTGVQSPAGGSSATLSTTLGSVAPADVLSLS
jgi:flagellar basal-body rod modification protein FlgD